MGRSDEKNIMCCRFPRLSLELNQRSMIDYCQRYWKGLESTVNYLINAR